MSERAREREGMTSSVARRKRMKRFPHPTFGGSLFDADKTSTGFTA